MSLLANIDHLAAAKGIVALCVDAPGNPRQLRGVESWNPILEGAINLLGLTGESTIRLVIGKHTMVVQKELGETVAVVLPTGHAIAKSLRRMIRRMAKKDRGPFIAKPEVTTQAPTQSAPTQPPASPATSQSAAQSAGTPLQAAPAQIDSAHDRVN